MFVGNVPYDAVEDELRDLFSRAGVVTSMRLVCDRETGTPKGYAFCDYAEPQGAREAIDRLKNVEYNGRRLRVDGVEKELSGRHGAGGGLAIGDDGPSHGPRRSGSFGGGSFGGPAPYAPPIVPVAVPTLAERQARLKATEADTKARAAAAEEAERAEVGRLMETLTPQQVIGILCEVQRLAVKAPEVARALVTENQQLALALQHAQFLAGMVEEAPLRTEPEVRERARNVREALWGVGQAPAREPSGAAVAAAAAAAGPSMPVMQAGVAGFHGGLHTAMPTMVAHVPAAPVMSVMQAVPGFAQPPPMLVQAAAQPTPVAAEVSIPVAVAAPAAAAMQAAGGGNPSLPELLHAASANEASRQAVMERLVKLSPQEIDLLPHEDKVQLLEFLRPKA